MPLYKPPTQVTTVEMPYISMVTKADPDFERRKHYDIEYEFDAKVFLRDPYRAGAYNYLSNVYPVGAASGGLDQAAVAAKAPTAGYPDTPGLYQAPPVGGWA